MRPFEISRTYDAPRAKVWQAWTEPSRLKHWWGPKGFTVHTCKVDLRPGGTFLYGMKAPNGDDMWGKFVYREIKAPEKLVFVVSFSDPQGGVTRHPWSPGWPAYILSTVTFTEQGPKETMVSISWIPHDATEAERRTFEEGRPSMTQGWGGTLDQLEAYLGR
ncbi:MAG TPA: SRPBCC domain-containing protein [Burkholderiales bacterium]|nr:SRPBCC domain-containing protein [Burkholderiales bacterium]